MAPWVMPLYIFSGIIMAIGAYLTIRYRPYCTLKSPEREIAMELHRKKLMKESMSEEEDKKEKEIMRANRIFGYWVRIISIAIVVHLGILFILFMRMNWHLEMPLYIVSGFLLILSHINWFTNANVIFPFCLFNSKDKELAILEIYHQQKIGTLNLDEQQIMKNTKTEIMFHSWQRVTFYSAIFLHILASVLHSVLTLLNGK
ncbi:MAG: hypothetical protein PHI47_07180 [Sulfuricurvum sp.]|uniref:hypothetical protein n=1 Tax=Sulfuricurvum sp. TaxID=2025608 RepID=UPI00262CA68E|nr:hypothetical protein [Sulfuricurvum sp.]MDD5159816.1 hypothetical protein [Sulfuricurvum sp.]